MALILSNLSTLCLLLFIIVQILQSRSQSVEISASGSMCTQECGPGYKCVSGRCERQSCNNDCSGKEIQPICGSDGVTYNNLCELEKARCEKAMHISVRYNKACVTLPPPSDHCSAHQHRWDTTDVNEIMSQCNDPEIIQKAEDGTLQEDEMLPCYRPTCDGENYAKRQCGFFAYNWCWCATDDGKIIANTFEKDKPQDVCNQRKSCNVSGTIRRDGELFSPPSGCGLCECLDDEVTCFEDYIPNINGQLNSTQLTQLKTELVLLFYFERNQEKQTLVDIRDIHRAESKPAVSETARQNILTWKFNHYDMNNDNVLNPTEQFVFRNELYQYVRCSDFFDHATEIIDDDSNRTISLDEWNRFFDENTSSGSTSGSTNGPPDVSSAGSSNPVKRSAPASSVRAPVMRKPLHLRSKFRYILF